MVYAFKVSQNAFIRAASTVIGISTYRVFVCVCKCRFCANAPRIHENLRLKYMWERITFFLLAVRRIRLYQVRSREITISIVP